MPNLRRGAVLRSTDPRDHGREVVIKAMPWHGDQSPSRSYQVRNRQTGRVTVVKWSTLQRTYVMTGEFEADDA